MIRRSLRDSLGGGIPLLFSLYMLQGLPFGLVTGSLPLLLSNTDTVTSSGGDRVGGDYRGASWLAMAALPYGFKLLWGPYVDTTFSKYIGRRKSWIIPCNLLTSLLWFELSMSIDELIQRVSGSNDSIQATAALMTITSRLFLITLIMAIGDVAVDGWALTVKPRLFSAASLSQTLGMTLGNFVTNAGVLCGQTQKCHQFVFQSEEPIPLYYFSIFVAVLHIIVTIIIVLFISESRGSSNGEFVSSDNYIQHKYTDDDNYETNIPVNIYEMENVLLDDEELNKKARGIEVEMSNTNNTHKGNPLPNHQTSVKQIIQLIVAMSRRKHCRTLAWLLVTSKFALALTENGVLPSVEYMQAGGDMDKLAVVIACQYPIQGVIGFYVVKHLTTGDPIALWKKTHIVLLALSASIPFAISLVASFVSTSSSSSYIDNQWMGALILGFVLAINNVVNKVLFIAMGTWFNMISDETAGGTIITLLNSLSNIGRFFPRAPAFWLADQIGASNAVWLMTIAGVVQFPYVSSWMQELKSVDKREWLLIN